MFLLKTKLNAMTYAVDKSVQVVKEIYNSH